jgi:hypothetical protein
LHIVSVRSASAGRLQGSRRPGEYIGSNHRYFDSHFGMLPQGVAHGRARLGSCDKIAKLGHRAAAARSHQFAPLFPTWDNGAMIIGPLVKSRKAYAAVGALNEVQRRDSACPGWWRDSLCSWACIRPHRSMAARGSALIDDSRLPVDDSGGRRWARRIQAVAQVLRHLPRRSALPLA